MSSLRQELKQFEAAFRKEHGKDPSPQDIRARPDIAKKYKQYQREKSAAKVGKPPSSAAAESKSDRPVASTSTAPANPFKTPTKPKSRSRTTRPNEANPEGPSSDVLMGPASPSQRLSAGSSRSKPASQSTASADSKAPASLERFVVANSPSKLRALAALHSTSGSPNKRSSGTGLASTASNSSRSAAPPLFFDSLQAKSAGQTSPQKKAANPFASPQKGAFGAFEREERENLRARRAELKKQRNVSSSSLSSSVLGKGATSVGAGWGTATLIPTDERTPFVRTASRSSASGMDVDEVDDFFGGGTASQQRSPGGRRQNGAIGHDDDPEEDESLGPSPVKPATSSASLGSELVPPYRPFQPLIPDRPPSTSAASSSRQPSQPPSARPKPFLAPLPASQKSVASATAAKNESTVPQKRPDPGDRADAFHADQAEKPDAKRKKVTGGAKPSGSASGTANSKGNARAKAQGSTRSAAIGAVQHGPVGEIVVEVGESEEDAEDRDSASGAASGSDEEAGDGPRAKKKRVRNPKERIVIHDKAAMARQKALERQERYRERRDNDDDDEAADGDGELEAIDISTTRDEDRHALEEDYPETSLFGPTRRVDLLTKLGTRARSRSRSRSPSTRHADEQAALAASLPADLAEILSLRTSPSKAHVSTAKARQVARILGEPSGQRATGRVKPGGLLDFASDDEGGVGAAEDEGEGDDDWDEEVDGWEGAGEAMDGYYSGEEY